MIDRFIYLSIDGINQGESFNTILIIESSSLFIQQKNKRRRVQFE
jgi:hypothetical protein